MDGAIVTPMDGAIVTPMDGAIGGLMACVSGGPVATRDREEGRARWGDEKPVVQPSSKGNSNCTELSSTGTNSCEGNAT